MNLTPYLLQKRAFVEAEVVLSQGVDGDHGVIGHDVIDAAGHEGKPVFQVTLLPDRRVLHFVTVLSKMSGRYFHNCF